MKAALREATPADIDVLVGFVVQLYAQDHIPVNEHTIRSALADLVGDPSLGRVWTIDVESETVGYVVLTFGYSLEYGGRDAFVDELFIAASHRGQGLGTEALRLVETVARGFGIRALHLEVDQGNVGARDLYRRVGFEEHDRYLMTKRIDG